MTETIGIYKILLKPSEYHTQDLENDTVIFISANKLIKRKADYLNIFRYQNFTDEIYKNVQSYINMLDICKPNCVYVRYVQHIKFQPRQTLRYIKTLQKVENCLFRFPDNNLFSGILYWSDSECIKTIVLNNETEKVINWYLVIGYSMLFSITLSIILLLLYSDCPRSEKAVTSFGFKQQPQYSPST